MPFVFHHQPGDTTTSSGPVAPAQAQAAGFNTLVFNDDFTTTNTIAPDTSTSSGYKWYPYLSIPATDYSVNTTATAASNNGGNGGPKASPSGGILSILEASFNNGECLTTVSTSTYSAGTGGNASTYGGLGNGFWKHFYIEAYIRYDSSVGNNNGWPAFWSAGVDWWHNSNHSELDFLENLHSGNYSTTIHQWISNVDTPNGGVIMVDQKPVNSNWHTYGMLWTSTGSGTGQLQAYFDDVLQATIQTGTGQTVSQLEANIGQEIQLGCGTNATMYVDWVRVWQ